MNDIEGTAGDTSGAVMNRRALLRAGGVVAGIAGIGGYAAAQAPAADAAAGDPVLAGRQTSAGTESTALRIGGADADGPTLILGNSGPGVPLRLEQQAAVDLETAQPGDLMNIGGDLRFVHQFTSSPGSVYTSLSASQLIPVSPFRAVDTRTVAGRAKIVAPPSYFDSTGRLIGGYTITIDLSDEVYLGTAIFANLTVTQPTADGYLTLWPGGTRRTSTLNYSAGQTVANFCVSGLGGDTVQLYAKATTHVLLDVVAFAAGSEEYVNRPLLVAAGASKLTGPAYKPPAWWTARNGQGA
jgi:hypothetical protein